MRLVTPSKDSFLNSDGHYLFAGEVLLQEFQKVLNFAHI